MNVSIIGTGYVGLVTGACLAEKAHRVVCVDSDAPKVAAITAGKAPFHEPGLDELVARHVRAGTLSATTDLPRAVAESSLTLIATGTPFDGQRIDLSYVQQAARQVGEVLARKKSYHAVVVKSTVVPGTTDTVVRPILEESSGKKAGPDFGVGMNPEFLSEGQAIDDFMVPDRIVLGGIDSRTIDAMAELYRGFEGTPTLRTSNAAAEFIKYASNSLLATMISFANNLSDLCATVPGVDVAEVMRGLHLMRELTHRADDGRRTSAGINSFLFPGCGFGGSCLPKDVKALSAWGQQRRTPAPVLDAALQTNKARPEHVVSIVRRALGDLKGRQIAVLGLAFKPGTDDVRESPAFPIIDLLLNAGAVVRAHDPVALGPAALVLKGRDVSLSESLETTLQGAHAAVLITRWPQYRDLPSLLNRMNPRPALVDTRRMLDRAAYSPYFGVGLGS